MDMGKRFEAEQSFQKAISITADMANHLQHALLAKGVQCIVAPYEAGLFISAEALAHWHLSLGQGLDTEGGVCVGRRSVGGVLRRQMGLQGDEHVDTAPLCHDPRMHACSAWEYLASLSLSISLSPSLSLHLSLSISLSPSLPLSPHLSRSSSLSLSVCVSLSPTLFFVQQNKSIQMFVYTCL